ncbi:PqqD family protein [Paenarthrobacter nitroguajacolicus]|uniref:PqqD family protein n=1 Tax=Paenarthrobacter nitroguajacolicus TaxID=211146 RepID=A0A558GZS5_PAENT|nr:PqqD family protein [Paenarthrobacter nitroguajacolicus]TVU62379.1 PqqD family protein [Paenarthrobacter nitroguajacolicus]
MDKWYRPSGIAFELCEEAVYVLDLRDLQGDLRPRALQGPAAAIWLTLGTVDSPCPELDLVKSVAEEYGMELHEIEGPALDFLRDLESAGLAERMHA